MSDTVSTSSHPARLAIDYPDRKLNRATSFFRPIVIIPIAIVLCLVSGLGTSNRGEDTWRLALAAGGIIFLPTLLMLLFRWKYPRWWFDWNLGLTRFCTRVGSYLLLLTDVYPSTDEEQGVHLELPYPDPTKDLKVGLPLVKWFLAIPHYVILAFLAVAVVFVTIVAWFAILFSGRYPKDMHRFVVGVMRWALRVDAYAFLLVTDVYPPFSLD
jgi:hypothetical protein